ncbi:hypothetical protein QPK87_17610 [Kamptonema cortianum]|nr:hypothetical protein [Geitlerinema splendidum]MDK3158372.1 hypothetical protein [Kamptonema cortianum]
MFNFLKGEQYLDTGWFGVFFTLFVIALILGTIARARGKNRGEMFIRRIAGLNAIDDAIGRATEMGKPVLMVPGLGVLDAISVQAINIFAQVTKTAIQFATPIRLCCGNAAVYAVAQEVIRNVYQTHGASDKFTAESVQFVSDQQFAFAAGVSGIIHRERVAATFLLGTFYAESLIFAETSNAIGAIQVAGSTSSTQTPFFIAACDYVLIGDEFYAASAYLTREPVLVGSLLGQDFAKMAMTLLMIIGIGLNSIDRSQMTTETRQDAGGVSTMVPTFEGTDREGEAKRKGRIDTRMHRLFNPFLTEELVTVERQPREQQAPQGEGE